MPLYIKQTVVLIFNNKYKKSSIFIKSGIFIYIFALIKGVLNILSSEKCVSRGGHIQYCDILSVDISVPPPPDRILYHLMNKSCDAVDEINYIMM